MRKSALSYTATWVIRGIFDCTVDARKILCIRYIIVEFEGVSCEKAFHDRSSTSVAHNFDRNSCIRFSLVCFVSLLLGNRSYYMRDCLHFFQRFHLVCALKNLNLMKVLRTFSKLKNLEKILAEKNLPLAFETSFLGL